METNIDLPAQLPSSAGPSPRPDKQVKTRSRNGCLVCRARRIRCDEGKPECQRCIKYSAECVYPAKKTFDRDAITKSLSKRHKANQSPSSPADIASLPPTILSSPFGPGFTSTGAKNDFPPRLGVASTSNVRGESSAASSQPGGVKLYDDAPTSMDALMALCRMTKMGSFFSGGEMPPDYLRESFQDPDELRCLHHCLAYTLSIIVVKEDYNPWVQHIAPMFLFPTALAPTSSEALRYAMAATGATHLAYLRNRLETERDSLDRMLSVQYRSRAMILLRQARKDPREVVSDAFLAAAICIGHNDVLSAEISWREAWGYCKDSLAARGGCEEVLFGRNPVAVPGEVERVLIEHLAFGDLTKSLSTGDPPHLLDGSSEWWERLGQPRPGHEMVHSIELTKGVHRETVRLIARTATLIANKRSLRRYGLIQGLAPFTASSTFFGVTPDIALDAYTHSVSQLEADLGRWTLNESVGDQRTRIGSLAYWHMCRILLRKYIQDLPMEDPDCQSSAKAILELCVEAGDKIEFLNWPLLVASCIIRDGTMRDQSRAVIKTFAYQCCNEIKVLHEVVEEVWRRMDDGWDEDSYGWVEVMLEMGRGVMMA